MKTIMAALLLLAAPLAQADTYRVDALVFLDKSASSELGRSYELPDLGKSINLDNAAALKDAGITLLPEDQFGLAEQWKRLKSSRQYQPLIRLAWVQENPPVDRSLPLRLSWGETMVVEGGDSMSSGLARPVDGSIALMLGNYLNLDVNLLYTERTGRGVQSWRLREKRRLKRDELHHLDSPRLGVIARVSKVKT